MFIQKLELQKIKTPSNPAGRPAALNIGWVTKISGCLYRLPPTQANTIPWTAGYGVGVLELGSLIAGG